MEISNHLTHSFPFHFPSVASWGNNFSFWKLFILILTSIILNKTVWSYLLTYQIDALYTEVVIDNKFSYTNRLLASQYSYHIVFF